MFFGNKGAFVLLFATIFTMTLLFSADVSIYLQIFEIVVNRFFVGKVLLHPNRYEQAGKTNVRILYIYKYKTQFVFE